LLRALLLLPDAAVLGALASDPAVAAAQKELADVALFLPERTDGFDRQAHDVPDALPHPGDAEVHPVDARGSAEPYTAGLDGVRDVHLDRLGHPVRGE
jgi:hypothetical protein